MSNNGCEIEPLNHITNQNTAEIDNNDVHDTLGTDVNDDTPNYELDMLDVAEAN